MSIKLRKTLITVGVFFELFIKGCFFSNGCTDFCTAIYVIIEIPNGAIARIKIVFGNIMMINNFYRKERG